MSADVRKLRALRRPTWRRSAEAVVAVVDLGSAYLSAATAIEMLAAPLQTRVLLADAPLVEGAVLAAVAAAGGDDAPTVRMRAEEAREMRKLP